MDRLSITLSILGIIGLSFLIKWWRKIFKKEVIIDPCFLSIQCNKNTVSCKKKFCIYNKIDSFVYDIYVLIEIISGEQDPSTLEFIYRNFDQSYTHDIGENTQVNYTILRLFGINYKKNNIVLLKIDNIPPSSYLQLHGDFNKTCNVKLTISSYSLNQQQDVFIQKSGLSIPFQIPKKIGNILLKGVGMPLKKKH